VHEANLTSELEPSARRRIFAVFGQNASTVGPHPVVAAVAGSVQTGGVQPDTVVALQRLPVSLGVVHV